MSEDVRKAIELLKAAADQLKLQAGNETFVMPAHANVAEALSLLRSIPAEQPRPDVVELLREARGYVSISANSGSAPGKDLRDRIDAALASSPVFEVRDALLMPNGDLVFYNPDEIAKADCDTCVKVYVEIPAKAPAPDVPVPDALTDDDLVDIENAITICESANYGKLAGRLRGTAARLRAELRPARAPT